MTGRGIIAVFSLVLPILVGACTPKIAPTTPAGATIGDLAREGRTVFSVRCSRCHGAQGQGNIGPAIIGDNVTLERYGTAQVLWDFISTAMPFDAPGTLPKEEYERVMSYLLVENNLVRKEETFDRNALGNLTLEKQVTSTESRQNIE